MLKHLFGLLLLFLLYSGASQVAFGQSEARPDTTFLHVVQIQKSRFNSGASWSQGGLRLAGLGMAARATITCREYPDYSETVDVPADSFAVYTVPDWLLNVMIEVDSISNRVIAVNSTHPILAYQYGPGGDVTFLPSGQLAGFEHRISSYQNSGYISIFKLPFQHVGSYCVCALEDSTEVEITNRVRSLSGIAADSAFIVRIDKNQCYSMFADSTTPYADFTGSRISSSRRVHVIASHSDQGVPADSSASGWRGSSQYTTEYLPPVERWQRSIIVSSLFPGDSADLTRILAAHDNTQLYVGGQKYGQPIGAGEFVDMFVKEPILITSNNPILGTILTRGNFYPSEIRDTSHAQTMSRIPFLEDLHNSYTVYLQQDVEYMNWHALRIYADIEALSTLKIDGDPVSVDQFVEVGEVAGRRFAIGTIIVPDGLRRITTNASSRYGFALIAFGRSIEGYGYAYTLSKMYLPWSEQASVTEGRPYPMNDLVGYAFAKGEQVRIDLTLEQPNEVVCTVFDIAGAKLASIPLGWLDEGSHLLPVDLSAMASGTYYLRFSTAPETSVKVILLP